jgi:hypothetical protein
MTGASAAVTAAEHVIVQVSNECGGPEALTYGTKLYRLDKRVLIGDLVKKIDEDHGMTGGMTYMDNKIMVVSVGIGDDQDDEFIIDGARQADRQVSNYAFSDEECIPNRIAIMKRKWKSQAANTVVTEVKLEESEDEGEWKTLGLTRPAWVSQKLKDMSKDVEEVAEKFEAVCKELEDAKKDVTVKEIGLFAIGQEFATRYLETKMFCSDEKQGIGLLSNWQTNRLQGVMSHVPREYHESDWMQERGEFNRVANKLTDTLTESSAGANWLSTTIDRPINKRAAAVVLSNMRASAKSHRSAEKADRPPAKAPPPGMQDARGSGSADPMPNQPRAVPEQPRAVDVRDDLRAMGGKARPGAVDVRLTDNTGKGPVARREADRRDENARREREDEEHRLSHLPDEVRAHNCDTRQAGMSFRGPVTDYLSKQFWGNEVRFLRGDVKFAYERWKIDCERQMKYLATRTCVFQGFHGFYEIMGTEFRAIVKGIARHRPEVMVLLTSRNERGVTLRGTVFVRYATEIDARNALIHFHGRRFGIHHLNVILSTRETTATPGNEKGKMPGGKAVSNENIILVRNEIAEMADHDVVLADWWGDVDLGRAFVTEFTGEGRRAHQHH